MIKSKLGKKVALVLLNDLIIEDFESIVNSIEFKENILIVTNTLKDSKKDNIINKKKYCVNFLFDDFKNVDILIKKLVNFKNSFKNDFCGIIGLDEEYDYNFSKKIADFFNLPSNSIETLKLVSSKCQQIEQLKKNGVDVPDFRLFNTYNDIKDFKLPSVIKPVKGISSLGVYKNNTLQDLKNNFIKLQEFKGHGEILSLTNVSNVNKDVNVTKNLANVNKATVSKVTKKDTKVDNDFIIEEFIDGNEYSCDFLLGIDGKELILLRVVKKLVSKDYFPFFEGLYLFNPNEDKDSEFQASYLKNVCVNVAKSLNITTGICMMDFRFDKKTKKIVVIEVTTRPGVDDFINLMSKHYSYTSINIALRNIFGTIDLNSFKTLPKGSSMIVYLIAPKPGVLTKFETKNILKLKDSSSIKDIDAVFNNLSNKDIVLYNKCNDVIKSSGLVTNPPIVGHVIVDNVKIKDIDKVTKLIRDNVVIKVE